METYKTEIVIYLVSVNFDMENNAGSHNCHLHTAFPSTPSAGLFKQGTYENEHLDFTKSIQNF